MILIWKRSWIICTVRSGFTFLFFDSAFSIARVVWICIHSRDCHCGEQSVHQEVLGIGDSSPDLNRTHLAVKSAFKFYPHKDYDRVSWFRHISQYTTPVDSVVWRHTVYLTRWCCKTLIVVESSLFVINWDCSYFASITASYSFEWAVFHTGSHIWFRRHFGIDAILIFRHIGNSRHFDKKLFRILYRNVDRNFTNYQHCVLLCGYSGN